MYIWSVSRVPSTDELDPVDPLVGLGFGAGFPHVAFMGVGEAIGGLSADLFTANLMDFKFSLASGDDNDGPGGGDIY